MLTSILIQVVALAAIVELCVQCMSLVLRTAIKQNCYRVDGTRSTHRSFLETRAKYRLTRDVLVVFAVVFLTGNAVYYLIDSRCQISSMMANDGHGALSDNLQSVEHVMGEDSESRDGLRQASAEAALARLKKEWPWIAASTFAWLVLGCLVTGWGMRRAYRDFAAGISARAAEHFNLDMRRMTVSDGDVLNQRIDRGSHHGAASN